MYTGPLGRCTRSEWEGADKEGDNTAHSYSCCLHVHRFAGERFTARMGRSRQRQEPAKQQQKRMVLGGTKVFNRGMVHTGVGIEGRSCVGCVQRSSSRSSGYVRSVCITVCVCAYMCVCAYVCVHVDIFVYV